MRFRIQLGLIIILIVLSLSLLLSQKANPDSVLLFALKRVQEKAFLKLKSSPQERVDYMLSLLNTRLDEMRNLVNNKSYSFVLPTSLRYSTLAGEITELVISNNLKDKLDSIKQTFINHQKLLQDLYTIYPKNIPDNEEWKFIQDDYNYLKIYLNKLSSWE